MGKSQREVGRAHPATVGQPLRKCEVEERRHGRDAGFLQQAKKLAVARESGVVPLALDRLHPAPLDREAIGVGLQVLHQRDVLAHPVPVVDREAALVTAGDPPRLLFEPRPVVAVATLDLVRGGGGAPEEPRRPGRERPGQILGGEVLATVREGEIAAGQEPQASEAQHGHGELANHSGRAGDPPGPKSGA